MRRYGQPLVFTGSQQAWPSDKYVAGGVDDGNAAGPAAPPTTSNRAKPSAALHPLRNVDAIQTWHWTGQAQWEHGAGRDCGSCAAAMDKDGAGAGGKVVADRAKLDANRGDHDTKDAGGAGAENAAGQAHTGKSPKKRRKVNHGETKKLKNGKPVPGAGSVDDSDAPPHTPSDVARASVSSTMGPPPAFDGTRQRSSSGFSASGVMSQGDPMSLVQPASGTVAGFSDAWLTAQNFHDMNSYNPNYMIGPHVTHEFNLLNDFLHSGLLDDSGALASEETPQNAAFTRTGQADMLPGYGNRTGPPAGNTGPNVGSMPPPPTNVDGKSARTATDKTREYYLQAADPSGNDNAEERMARVLRAKYDAGLLRPFNYINGYARLGKYLDGHIAASSKQKILRTINQFRPKFREKAQGLTDMQLIYVEMWFEKQLMDYDRVFASMAVPACCWRRTGEIFRGNKEMAELINVPVDQLRDGKIALHEILTEESMVRYWEEFGTIAFDPAHETLLTACSLKNPSDTSDHPIVKCCFSFTIRRDEHKL
ncbi:Zn cluster transcription factor Rds2 [Purpureocillium lavendulum]|uniref:Zn cluster transcription factor Rds2 n=1 Tax=Purpureocillium lavendulum TaxID=1247861 RepID=A0AB34FMN6_9HYPO|nr:Zn cluster transcription factor Rds2 [Purpureocillium lavendulum]